MLNVHNCEEPSWHVSGSIYSGGLGWMIGLWTIWRAPWMPATAAAATPEEQAWAMRRFIDHTQLKWRGRLMPVGWWPDQHGCTGGY